LARRATEPLARTNTHRQPHCHAAYGEPSKFLLADIFQLIQSVNDGNI
jgi:hypothetical protein